MGFLPIFLALSLFIMLWGIVVSQFLLAERRKILALAAEMGISETLAATEAKIMEKDSTDFRGLKAKMLRYNKLISSYPYKIVAGLMHSKKF